MTSKETDFTQGAERSDGRLKVAPRSGTGQVAQLDVRLRATTRIPGRPFDQEKTHSSQISSDPSLTMAGRRGDRRLDAGCELQAAGLLCRAGNVGGRVQGVGNGRRSARERSSQRAVRGLRPAGWGRGQALAPWPAEPPSDLTVRTTGRATIWSRWNAGVTYRVVRPAQER